jgi:hypothetical protein
MSRYLTGDKLGNTFDVVRHGKEIKGANCIEGVARVAKIGGIASQGCGVTGYIDNCARSNPR